MHEYRSYGAGHVTGGLPVLSAQLMTAPTGRPSEMRNLAPEEPPRPERHKSDHIRMRTQKQPIQSTPEFKHTPLPVISHHHYHTVHY